MDSVMEHLDLDDFAESKEEKRSERDSLLVAASKTVDTFSGIIGRKMWLKTGAVPCTDGHQIQVPLTNPYFYQITEHEIAHNLFNSNFEMKAAFVEEYETQIETALKAHGKKLAPPDRKSLSEFLHLTINILEDHRVNSLWAILYPGSYRLMLEMAVKMLRPKRKHAHEDLLTFMLMSAYDIDGVPSGKFDRLRPAIVASLKKVVRKGPNATFVVGKWLVTQIVSEFIRSLQGQPPPPDAGNARVATDLDDLQQQGESQAQPPSSGNSQEDDSEEGEEGEQSESSGEGTSDPSASQGESKAGNTGSSASSEWEPPPVSATTQERIEALSNLIQSAKNPKESSSKRMREFTEDVQPSRFVKEYHRKAAKKEVQSLLTVDVSDVAQMQRMLEVSEQEMAEEVESIKEKLETQRARDEDEWITRDSGMKVSFRDITHPKVPVTPLDAASRAAVNKLRDLFMRTKNKRSLQLDDYGSTLDLPALIANKVSDRIDPCFKRDVSGKGFKALVLVDRSASMAGQRSIEAQTATRILRKALKLPNVQFHVWGFNGGDGVNIARVAPNIDIMDAAEMYATGDTPLHVALRTAVNWMGEGSETKQILIVTDGLPTGAFRGKDSEESVAAEVRRARKQHINVTCIAIGGTVGTADLKTMFGSQNHWVVTNSRSGHRDSLQPAMVKVIGTSFREYLAHS